MSNIQIAIDGPVGSGKSDISSQLAKKINYIYINTGAMYRTAALLCFRNDIPYKDEEKAIKLLKENLINVTEPKNESKRSFRILLNNEDVTEELFTPEMDRGSSDVSTLPSVRLYMVGLQQKLALGKNVVMEGRDIGYRVLPDAQLKIYLTATLQIRTERRYKLALSKGISTTYDAVLKDTQSRDLQDTTRKTDPLKKLPDAWVLDTSDLTQEQVVQQIINQMKNRNLI